MIMKVMNSMVRSPREIIYMEPGRIEMKPKTGFDCEDAVDCR